MTNSPERKRKSSGRSRVKLNSWSVQWCTDSTFSAWWGDGRAGASAKAYEDIAEAAGDGVAEAGGAPEVPEPIDGVDPALLQAQEEAASFRDLALRAQAEAENIRRKVIQARGILLGE